MFFFGYFKVGLGLEYRGFNFYYVFRFCWKAFEIVWKVTV